ncbi:MAG: YgaP family membrane protein [Hyphomonas sp.]
MNLDRAVLAFGGLVVLLSLTLGYFVSPYWFLLTAFAGLNMLQAAFTGICPAAVIFKLIGVQPGHVFR